MKNATAVRHTSRHGLARDRFLAPTGVEKIDACIRIVTAGEKQCKSVRARRIFNRIQLGLLRLRLAVALPIMNPKQRATAVEILGGTPKNMVEA